MKILTLLLALVGLCACAAQGGENAGPADADTTAPAVVLFIVDGMDDQQIAIARNYLAGMNGRLLLDDMPVRVSARVRTVQEADPSIPNYVGDSASGGTAMATGVPVSEGRISTTAQTDIDLPTIMELAQAAGMRTGVATTSNVTDASPASFMAHINNRYCQVPRVMVWTDEEFPQDSRDCSADFKANGGAGSIAEQVADSAMDVVLGGGQRAFGAEVEGGGETILQSAEANGFTVITDRSGLAGAEPGERLLGLFAGNHLPERLRGEGGRIAEFVERRDGQPVWPEPFRCEPNPEFSGMPSLAEMTETALRQLGDGPFMLMVESASVDKASHYWRPCGHIGEMQQLDEALAVALAFADEHPATLVIVTADHGSSAQMVPQMTELSLQGFAPVGRFARIRTPEGGVMGVSYASNDSPHWEDHTGVHVPLYASGPGVDHLPQFVEQTDVFNLAVTHLGLAHD